MPIESESSQQLLLGRRIVITGAGRGLGRALAIVAADYGAEPILLGRDVHKLREVADTINVRTGHESMVVTCDLASPDNVAAACRSILDANPVVDVLINNGAPWLSGSLDELADADIASTISAAVTGTILMTKGLLPGLRQSADADIVNIVSTAGVLGWDINGGSVPFHAAKHGQSGFSDSLRVELNGTGIRVSAIYPPDFDDADPVSENWNASSKAGAQLSNREVVSTVCFILTAPRTCSFPFVIMENAMVSEK